MTSSNIRHKLNREALKPFREALYNFDAATLQSVISELFDPACVCNYCWPMETLEQGRQSILPQLYQPLVSAIPDLERRDYIVIAGAARQSVESCSGSNSAAHASADSSDWVGCAGYYTGVFENPWLDIPPTGHQVAMRFHEFYRFENARVVEVQALWDIPELMMQARAWPMAPSLGVDWLVPAPATQDGVQIDSQEEARGLRSVQLVNDMLIGLSRFATEGAAGMQLEKYWHSKMNWYGPAGIGTSRQINGFRHWHQIPFLKAMPDRAVGDDGGHHFGEGDYTAFTAWPGMTARISGDGWMGIAPSSQSITMRSLDFWRCENGRIRENWVLVDLLDVYNQIGVDVLQRMREFTGQVSGET